MKILIVEDDNFFQKFYTRKLQEIGYETEMASDGEEAMAKLQTFSPDIMLLDIIMPKKNGFQVLEEIKQNPAIQKIPVIVFSTLGQEKDVEKAKTLGAVDFINKSYFDFENLVTKIKTLTNQPK